ncbi:hypothetical protein Clacol_002034 [Clathrus columnatus]|uniref:Cytosine deaminase n=1 Tax=Clathrus columnatus TaxID=1419009 RepID=A0AAV4ZZP2_9AGAM|nr:hypothetical protein Clacol_002034 [Clathrus columnatus]
MTLVINNVSLPSRKDNKQQLCTVICKDSQIDEIIYGPSDLPIDSPDVVNGNGDARLCHSHVHLDKCNILDECDELVSGSFQEALELTSKVKASYTYESLVSRGRHLIVESIKYGVTAMRAHVEVDRTVQFKGLDAGLRLKEEFKDLCDIGLAVFAQDPFFISPSDTEPSDNYILFQKAAGRQGISAVGSAPYVEPSTLHARRNIDYVFELALENRLHIDFHLDYNLDPNASPMIHYVIDLARKSRWTERMKGKHITIGHAPRLCLFTPEEFKQLQDAIDDLPITFVGLPQTDMYMLGREEHIKPRGTLHVPNMVKKYGLNVAMSINNIGNAFTPQGSADPLALCAFGVAIFQTGLPNDCEILFDSVSNTSKRAVGVRCGESLVIRKGDPADLIIVHGNNSIQSLVLSPSFERTVIKNGRVISSRRIIDVIDPTSFLLGHLM